MPTFEVTQRGFGRLTFTDLYGAECSLQESSLADTDAIWLGVNDASPRILASKAASLGAETSETCGWIPFPVPDAVSFTTRMHLDRKQAKMLIKELRHFVKTGNMKGESNG
jgi:hypothetical protein